MKLLWISWKSIKDKNAGGAEVVTDHLLQHASKDDINCTLLTPNKFDLSQQEEYKGYKIIRRVSNVIFFALSNFIYVLKNRNKFDVVIEEVNTIPLLSFFLFGSKTKKFLFYHQLTRDVWWHQTPILISHFGYYIFEPIALFTYAFLARITSTKIITISNSTKKDLVRFGFNRDDISIISEGIELEPLDSLDNIDKYIEPTILSLGAVRPMKRTLEVVKAFEILVKDNPEIKLKIAGDISGDYGESIKIYIENSKVKNNIEVLGRISKEQKVEIMQKSHIIAVTSIKEGWGLIVTEANSQGTPAVVYDVDGLRDSVKNRETGLVTEHNNPGNLSKNMLELLTNKELYNELQYNAWDWSKNINFERSYKDFKILIN